MIIQSKKQSVKIRKTYFGRKSGSKSGVKKDVVVKDIIATTEMQSTLARDNRKWLHSISGIEKTTPISGSRRDHRGTLLDTGA